MSTKMKKVTRWLLATALAGLAGLYAQQPSLPVADLQGLALPATCTVGQRFMRTGAATEPLGQEWYVCSQANRWSRTNQKLYNVQAYGAVGDGVADDTAAIQTTITAALAHLAPAFFPCGTYKHTTLAYLNQSNVNLVGASKSCVTLLHSGGGNGFQTTTNIALADLQDFTIENITFQGNGADGVGLLLSSFVNSHVRNVKVTGYGSHGIVLATAYVNTFEKVESWNNGGDGVRLDAAFDPRGPVFGDQNINAFMGCSFVGNSGYGYHSIDSQMNPITGSTIEGNHLAGIWLERPYSQLIEGNFVENNGTTVPSPDIKITPTGGGNGFGVTIKANKLSGVFPVGAVSGIDAAGVQDLIVEGNYFQHHGVASISLANTVIAAHIGINYVTGDPVMLIDNSTSSNFFYVDAVGSHLGSSANNFSITSPLLMNITAPTTVINVGFSVAANGTFTVTSTTPSSIRSSGANSAGLYIDTNNALQQSYIILADQFAPKWQWGRDANNTFFMYDFVSARNLFQTSVTGQLGIFPTTGNVLIGTLTDTYPADRLQINGTMNAVSGYNVGANAGTSVTLACGGGQAVKSLTTVGGIVTAAACGAP